MKHIIAVIQVVGAIFTLFLFYNYLNSFSVFFHLTFSITSSAWSIFSIRVSLCFIVFQYYLLYIISFPQTSIFPQQFKSGKFYPSIYPIFHSLHVLFIFFLCIFIPIFIAQPFCT